ncbi:MAG TPA: NAD(P)-binding domain-containing protein [Candidatus Limnocylindria bacterium]|nr:NAD(P)-binding domain-containing protein [Candidatus Limnocylindria bacterium]
MKVAIIGTGNVGQALGSTLVRAGHDVTFAARDAAKARQVAQQLGAAAAHEPAKAAAQAEVTILAVPYGALANVADEIRDSVAGKVVIDPTNPGPATEGGSSAAEWLAEKLPEAHVAKALNTLFGSFMAQPDLQERTVDALFATNSDLARSKVAELLGSLGFRPLDVGNLDSARQMEAMAWLNIQLQMRYSGNWNSTFVLVGAPEAAIRQTTASLN